MNRNTDYRATIQTPLASYAQPVPHSGYGQQIHHGYPPPPPVPMPMPMSVGYAHAAGSSSTKAIAWIVGLIAVLAVCGAVFYFAPMAFMGDEAESLTDQSTQMLDEANAQLDDMSGTNTDDILRDDLEVDMGAITVDSNRYSSSGELEVSLTNTSSERRSFSIEIEATSRSGQRIATGTAYAASLAPGQTVDTDITFYPDGGASKYDLEDAEFDVIKVSMY